MWYFFPQADELPKSDSALRAEMSFRDEKISGLIEKRTGGQGAVMLFAGGSPAGAYTLAENSSQPISFAEFSILPAADYRALRLPNRALRLLWISLESKVQNVTTLQLEEVWKGQAKAWRDSKWSGLVEVRSEAYHGFLQFWDGSIESSDVFFSGVQVEPDLVLPPEYRNTPRTIVTFDVQPSAQAYQCSLLQHSAADWTTRALYRYKELVGQKLLQSLEREINRLVQPWEWEIRAENGMLTDTHFFLHADFAAHAYRAILMNAGAQMNFVIGNNLTQKLLTDTFSGVPSNESALLQTYRLIPAAFSE